MNVEKTKTILSSEIVCVLLSSESEHRQFVIFDETYFNDAVLDHFLAQLGLCVSLKKKQINNYLFHKHCAT